LRTRLRALVIKVGAIARKLKTQVRKQNLSTEPMTV
jgi:hypothetical protein